MLTIITLLTLGAGLFWLGARKETAPATLLGCALCLAAVVCLLTLININSRFEEEKENYMNLKMQVDDYNALPDSCKNVSFEYDIRKDVLRMNNTVSRHRVMSRSPWVNVWHSKEIGNLEKLRVYGPRGADNSARHDTGKAGFSIPPFFLPASYLANKNRCFFFIPESPAAVRTRPRPRPS